MPLGRDAFLAVDDLRREEVEVPGGTVLVRVMRMDELERFQAAAGALAEGDAPSVLRWMALLLAHTLCDETGALLFGPDDVDALMRKAPETVEPLMEAALRVNRLGRYGKREDAEGKG